MHTLSARLKYRKVNKKIGIGELAPLKIIIVKRLYLSLTILLACRLAYFVSSHNITLGISNLIGRGLPCHGSRCRFESDLIRVLGYIV